jgi:hypothetical protein
MEQWWNDGEKSKVVIKKSVPVTLSTTKSHREASVLTQGSAMKVH